MAARLAEAATLARDRGAPSVAASPRAAVARHTPADGVPGPDERRLQAAEDAITAGELDLARDIARDVLTRATVPADRVRAWMVVIDTAGQAMAEVDAVFPQALADAGDDPGCSPWSATSWPGGPCSSRASFARGPRGGRARGTAGRAGRGPAHRTAGARLPGPDWRP